MREGPAFFVPAATPEEQESIYETFAGWCRKAVPPMTERIYSITYRHNGEEWTATVGEALRGTKTQIRRVSGRKSEVSIPTSDPAIVLAIFAGLPFFVVTNHRINGRSVGSAWENPFMAGQPESIIRFALPKE
jgi:hypothetical protein